MRNISVVYATKTRHSAKYAESIAKVLDVKAQNVTDHPQVDGVDLLFIVGGIYGGKSMPELLKFAEDLDDGKVRKAVIVTSSAGMKEPQVALRNLLEGKGIEVLDEITCPGNFLFFRMGHPNASDLAQVAESAAMLAKKRSRLDTLE